MGGLLVGSLFVPHLAFSDDGQQSDKFQYCLNTSTISGCGEYSIVEYIEIASKAGYDAIEVWVGDLRDFLTKSGSLNQVKEVLDKSQLTVANAIGFAPWLNENGGLEAMQNDMELLAKIGCQRIAAPPVGHEGNMPLDLFKTGRQYKKLLELGRETGVMPQLEFWGVSEIFNHLGQAVMVTTVSGDTDARILPDVFHMFKGGTEFSALEMLNPDLVDVFHLNDYMLSIPREQQKDEDRVYPGDGDAPINMVIEFLNRSSKSKTLSVELFNKEYWKLPAEEVAKTALLKMQKIVQFNS